MVYDGKYENTFCDMILLGLWEWDEGTAILLRGINCDRKIDSHQVYGKIR